MAQFIGSLIVCTATFASAMAMFAALNAFGLLRVSKAGELIGLDIDQHRISAYPEYVFSPRANIAIGSDRWPVRQPPSHTRSSGRARRSLL